jgi:hypothetical protein
MERVCHIEGGRFTFELISSSLLVIALIARATVEELWGVANPVRAGLGV